MPSLYPSPYIYRPSITLRYTQPYSVASVPVAPIVRPNPYVDRGLEGAIVRAPSAYQPSNVESTNLENGPERLARSLASRDTEGVWMDFLAPNRIADLVSRNDTNDISALLQRYDGVVANPELAWVVRLDGFVATRELLRRHASAANATKTRIESDTESEAGEKSIPVPVPVPEPAEDLPTPAVPIKDATSVEL